MTIKDLQPKAVWENFYGLTRVPRPSKHEGKVQDYLLGWGKEHGVDVKKDDTGNIIFTVPATPGYENRKGVIMQAHMDMVPQKTADTKHDFLTDPIETEIDGEWVTAKGTTLGAVNGIGVALALSVLQDKTLRHGPLEALITYDEETGMTGANSLKAGILKGDILLNLDSEEEGELCTGCAGGVDGAADFAYRTYKTPEGFVGYKITVKGLKGGHSGMDISLFRGNANKIICRLLEAVISEYDVKVASITGGSLRNAIPFECEVVLTLPKENVAALKEDIEEWKTLFNHEYRTIEENIQFFAEDVETPAMQTPEEIQDNLLDAIYGCHNGVLRMIPVFPSVVETSSNLAIVNIEGGHAAIKILARSANESMKQYIATTLESTFSMAGMKVEFSGSYGGWDPNTDSELLHMLEKHYKELFGEDAIEQVDHAGLECSVILGKYPNLDVVSLGPTLRSPHTTIERCLIPTVAPFWELLKKTMAEVPEK